MPMLYSNFSKIIILPYPYPCRVRLRIEFIFAPKYELIPSSTTRSPQKIKDC